MGNKLSSIKVEAAYEIAVGMTGMRRDVILRLCALMNCKPENVRSIFGMSQEHVIWKDHQYFVSERKKCDMVLVAKFLDSWNRDVKNTGRKLVWTKVYDPSIFVVDTEMTKGVYGITIEKHGKIDLGLAAKKSDHSLARPRLYGEPGTCCICHCSIWCGNTAQVQSEFFSEYGKVTLRAELDTDRHVLYFFVGGAQIPHSIVDVPFSVNFAVSGYTVGARVKIKSVARLRRLTAKASVECAKYKWK